MQQLRKAIGFKTTVLLTINAILGTEIYFVPALGALLSGPASIISWLIMSLIAIFIAFYFAELVSMFPKAGGTYEFMKQSFGEVPSFLVGWLSWITANVTTAMLIVGSVMYILPNTHFVTTLGICLGFILFFNFINYIGIKQSSKMLMIFGISTIIPLIAIALSGTFSIDTSNYFPFFVFPASAILLSLVMICETFFGFEPTTFLSEEIKDARKILPKAIIYSTLFVIGISLAIAIVCLGVMNWEAFASEKAPLTAIASVIFGSKIGKIFSVLVFVPLIGTAAGWIVSSPRLLFAMARDKVFIKSIREVHPKYGTPHKAIIFQTIITIIITFVALGSYRSLLSVSIPLTVILYLLIVLCVTKLRISKPKTKRYFRAPLGKVGPVVITIFFVFILGYWIIEEGTVHCLLIDLSLILLGIPAYFMIKLQTDRKFIEKFFDKLGPLYNLYVLKILVRSKQRNEVISNAKIDFDDIVLDYGCASGTMTNKLAKIARFVVAADISYNQLERALRKLKFANNITYVKMSRAAPFKRETFDKIVSVVTMNYFVNPMKELKKLSKCLKKDGTAAFLSLVAPTITSHPFLKSNKETASVFKKAGFEKVSIERVRRFGIEYIYITANK